MNVSSKITQKLAALLVLTAALTMSAEFAGGGFVRAASETEAAAQVGKPAPEFTLPASNGKTVDLSQYKGKLVVLEWFNHGCPFVKKHYDSGNMQALQKNLPVRA
jgi:cytochrome oxidase Cu insertion factor (SCO1/SenC/PrrC family)